MLSRRVRTTLSILTLCGAMGFALVTSHAPSDSLNAQSSHSVATDPELFSGTAQPASTRAVSNPLKSFDGRVTIAELKVENGQSVEAGQLLAVLELSEFEARLKAARTSVEEAHFNLEKAEVALNHERETREYNIAKAEMDVEAAERKLKFFKEFDKEDSIEKGRQRVENAENSIEDQEDELKQLRKLYGKNELATESQDIVLRRSERRLEVSKKNLKIVKNEFKVLREVTIPAEEWRLPFEVRKAVRALEKARIDKRDALEKKEEELQKARKAH
ncbi:MAG: biotin/lipoyl-binding protein, partial [Planctomycetes bacterium]|nr:biotin/lipoyl-binding protein [Planctomycetota bacterium]